MPLLLIRCYRDAGLDVPRASVLQCWEPFRTLLRVKALSWPSAHVLDMGSQTYQILGVTYGIGVLVLAMLALKIAFSRHHRVLAIAWQDFVKQYVRMSFASIVMSAARKRNQKQRFLEALTFAIRCC